VISLATFYDPIITKRRGDSNEPLIAKTDIKKIINGRIILDEIPDRLSKCTVTGSIGGIVYIWYEISSGVPSLDTTAHTGTFLVDYLRGLVDFPLEANGETITVSSMGSGCQFFPASRVYTSFTDSDGNYDIEETLEEMINRYNLHTEDERIANEAIRESNEDIRVENENTRQSQELSRKDAETARVNAETTRVTGGALIKSGDTMTGDLNITTGKAIKFGNFRVVENQSLGSLDIEFTG
jgi:hypothetical protein